MNTILSELLGAIDLAASRALRQQVLSLHSTGLSLPGKTRKIKVGGKTLEIGTRVLLCGQSQVPLKIRVSRNKTTGNREIFTTQFCFIRLPLRNFLPDSLAINCNVFTMYSAN